MTLRRRVAGARVGEHRAFRRGASLEFAEHRPYTPGDDPRRIDWNAYARLGELVVRRFVAEEDVTLRLLVDASASMGFGAPAKLDVARRLAAGLGYLALRGSERVALLVGDGAPGAPALRGRGKVHALLASLDALRATGGARLDAAADRVLARRAQGPGVAVLFGDLLDEGATVRAAARLAAARHEVVVVHTLSREDLDPAPDDASALVDCETGASLDLVLDDEARAAYRAELARFLDEAARALRQAGARYVQAFPGRDALDVLTEVLTGRAGRAGSWNS